MKKIIFILALAFGFVFANTATAQSTTDDFTLEITTETSRADLNDMRLNLQDMGVTFNYNPSFTAERVLNGIKVRVTFEDASVSEYALNPMTDVQTLTIERSTNEAGEVVRFVGQK